MRRIELGRKEVLALAELPGLCLALLSADGVVRVLQLSLPLINEDLKVFLIRSYF
jgi:hypothetical protein